MSIPFFVPESEFKSRLKTKANPIYDILHFFPDTFELIYNLVTKGLNEGVWQEEIKFSFKTQNSTYISQNIPKSKTSLNIKKGHFQRLCNPIYNQFFSLVGRRDMFKRRMSLSSLGTKSYGKAWDNCSESKEDDKEPIVRHVPIIIEGDEDKKEKIADKVRNENNTESNSQYQTAFSKFSQAWRIPDDLSSLSSRSEQNLLEDIKELDMMMRARSRRRKSVGDGAENLVNRDRHVETRKESTTTRFRDYKRKPFSNISQVIL